MLDIILIFLKLPRLVSCPACGQSWIMFSMHIRKMNRLLFGDGMPYKYQLNPTGLKRHLKPQFFLLILFLDDLFIDESELLFIKFPLLLCTSKKSVDFFFYGY